MKGRSILLLVVVAVVLAAVAVITTRKEQRSKPNLAGKLVLPGLPVNDIERLTIAAGGDTAEIARINDVWVAPAKFNYPADFNKIRETLIKLADLKIGQQARLTDAQKAQLKLIAPSASATNRESLGTLVAFSGPGSKRLASLLIGDARRRQGDYAGPMGGAGYPDGQYVSADEGKTAFLIADSLSELSPNVRDWLDTEILNVNAADVSEVRLAVPGKPELMLTRGAAGGSLAIPDLAKDEEMDSSKLYSIEAAFSYLRFADVADPSIADSESGLDKPSVVTAVTAKGQVFTARLGACPTNRTDRFARFEVTLKPEETPAEGVTNAPPASAAADRRKFEEETRVLNAKLAPWTYLIESYKADSLLVTRDSLVKKKEPPKTEAKAAVKADAKEADARKP